MFFLNFICFYSWISVEMESKDTGLGSMYSTASWTGVLEFKCFVFKCNLLRISFSFTLVLPLTLTVTGKGENAGGQSIILITLFLEGWVSGFLSVSGPLGLCSLVITEILTHCSNIWKKKSELGGFSTI